MMKRAMAILLALSFAFAMCACAESAATDEPRATYAPEEETGVELPAGYVLVSTATQSGWLPLPTEGEEIFPLAQLLADGTEMLNVIHLMPNGVYIEDATCENHDCVNQGEVTLENKDERILSNMIICLPNQVMLQLYTAEETLEMLGMLPGEGAPEEDAEE
ncbi:MAG: NusG domain II-containing protein [Clostridia bacterium]|nr:NusG domain II-containing protein [Clostridia bacterium]